MGGWSFLLSLLCLFLHPKNGKIKILNICLKHVLGRDVCGTEICWDLWQREHIGHLSLNHSGSHSFTQLLQKLFLAVPASQMQAQFAYYLPYVLQVRQQQNSHWKNSVAFASGFLFCFFSVFFRGTKCFCLLACLFCLFVCFILETESSLFFKKKEIFFVFCSAAVFFLSAGTWYNPKYFFSRELIFRSQLCQLPEN